jgi:hypothetical protein
LEELDSFVQFDLSYSFFNLVGVGCPGQPRNHLVYCDLFPDAPQPEPRTDYIGSASL